MMRKSYQYIFHIIFVVFFVLLPYFQPVFYGQMGSVRELLFSAGSAVWALGEFYFFFLAAIPWLVKRPRKRQIALFILIFMATIGIRAVLLYTFVSWQGGSQELTRGMAIRYALLNSLMDGAIYIGNGTLFFFALKWFDEEKLRSEMKVQTKTTELALLRSQLHPHFLFNTLNSVYSLVYTKSDKAPQALMKLSEILRYMLYEARSERVELAQEIEYLYNLIQLHQLRTGKDDFVRMIVEGKTTQVFLPPMILISFVENSLKHGSSTRSPGVFIYIDVAKNVLHFSVKNYLRKKQPVDLQSGGVGLYNIRRRLELLYPDRHTLQITSDEVFYQVQLTLILSNNHENQVHNG